MLTPVHTVRSPQDDACALPSLSVADSLAHRLYNERLRRGWSQTRAGEHFGVGQPELSRWENGRKKPHESKLPAIAKFLRISLDECRALKHGIPMMDDGAITEVVRGQARQIARLELELQAVKGELAAVREAHDELMGTVTQGIRQMNDRTEAAIAALESSRQAAGSDRRSSRQRVRRDDD